MITITLKRSPNGFIRSFAATGHAGYAPEGSDIICAAITAIATTTIGSLMDIAKLNISYRTEPGDIYCETPPPEEMPSGQYLIARTLMDSLALGCRQIEASYGQKYVRVIEAFAE
ncbi:MAG: ribosomal-processing cysteine protease Prp [Ruminococcaceae bacterium]|nr:ribosomal-processing cysteine protease Prp [Oscillospiraceae bacterium]